MKECHNCKGTGKSSLGPVTNLDTGITTHDDCWTCEGKGEYKNDLKTKNKKNIWDHINDFGKVYNLMKEKKWSWMWNSKCKYVELRIDMRSGSCIIKDREGNRITPEDLAYQYTSEEEKANEK